VVALAMTPTDKVRRRINSSYEEEDTCVMTPMDKVMTPTDKKRANLLASGSYDRYIVGLF
jgi:hypothetical protein